MTYDERHSLHTSLQQFHLPKMVEGGIVDYNDQRTGVMLTEEAIDLDVYVETVSDNEVRWSTYFILLSTTLGLGLVAAELGIAPLTAFDASAWSVLTWLSFFVSSMVFAHHQRKGRVGLGEGPPPDNQH